jgi:hypothetical protein
MDTGRVMVSPAIQVIENYKILITLKGIHTSKQAAEKVTEAQLSHCWR